MFARFFKDRRANIAMLAAFLVPAVGVSAIAGVEMTNAMKLRQAAQKGIDLSVLGCATDAKSCNRSIFDSHMGDLPGYSAEQTDVILVRDGETGSVTGSASINMTHALLGERGLAAVIPSYTIDVNASGIGAPDQAGAVGRERLGYSEIIFVVDISLSIPAAAFRAIQDAAKEFVDRLTDAGTPLITIIPFAGAVRFPVGEGFENYLVSDSCDAGDDCAGMVEWNGCFSPESTEMLQVSRPTERMFRWHGNGRFVKDDGRTLTCPPAGSSVLLTEESGDAVKAHIDGMEQSWGTATYDGLAWALRVLNAGAQTPFRNGQAYDGEGAAIILFSDGIPTKSSGIDHSVAKQVMSQTCRRLANTEGVELFTSYFSNSSVENQAAKAVMRDCAPSLDHFWSSSETTVDEAFEKIGDMITYDVKARLTK